MKTLTTFLFASMFAGASYGQVVAIQVDKESSGYLRIENPLTIAVEKCSSRRIVVSTDNGKISGYHGHYVIVPDHVGMADITVQKKTLLRKLKTVGHGYFRVKRMPVAVSLNGQKDGNMSKQVACDVIAPAAVIECCGFDAKCIIDSFTVTVKRNDKVVFHKELHDSTGTRIDNETRGFFKTMHDKDKLLITGITYKDIDGTSMPAAALEFTITPATYTKPQDPAIDPITGTEIKKKAPKKSGK